MVVIVAMKNQASETIQEINQETDINIWPYLKY